jgi:hypothetical protein
MISNESYIFLAVFAALALVALIYLLSPKVSALIEDITKRGAEFRERVDALLRRDDEYPNEPKTFMMVGYVMIALQHHRAIWLLKDAELYGSGFALVRPVFDAWLRALWINAIATPEQIEQARHDKLTFPNVPKMSADIKPVYFGHAQQDPEFAKMVDDFFYWLVGPDPKAKDKADPRVTSLWNVLHGYTHPGARPLSRVFTGSQVRQNYSQFEIAQLLNLPTLALIFLMGPFFLSMGKQAEADEVHTLGVQFLAEFNQRLSKVNE